MDAVSELAQLNASVVTPSTASVNVAVSMNTLPSKSPPVKVCADEYVGVGFGGRW